MLEQAQARNQAAFARLQQELWRIEEPPETSADFRALVEGLGEGHEAEAKAVWEQMVTGRLALLRELLRAEGPLVARWKLSAEVSAQILTSVRAYVCGYVFLVLPADIERELYQVDDLPRLQETAFYVVVVWALYRLLLRKKPLIRTWVGTTGPLYRLWILIGPAIGLLLALIVVLDVAGFRVGAGYLYQGVVRSYVLLLLLWMLYRLFARWIRRLADRALSRMGDEQIEVSDVVMQQLIRVLGFVIVLVAAFVLGDAWEFGSYLTGLLDNLVLGQFNDGTVLTVLDVLTAALWIFGAHFIVHNLSGVMEFIVFPLIEQGDKGGRYVTLTLSRYAILLVGYSAAFLSLNFNFQSLSVVLAAFSVGIGFGLQEIIGNFISGLILLIERPVRVGDTITVGNTGGVVERITIRATVVTSWDDQSIIVPNKNFITQNVTNWTRTSDTTRRKIRVNLAHGTDVDKARRIMQEIVDSDPAVLKQPAPSIFFQNFGESHLEFEIWFRCHVDVGFGTMTRIRTEMYRRFREEGIELAVPRRRIEKE